MKFMSAREFRVNVGAMRRDLDRDEEVVLTANGRPFAVVSAVRPESLDVELRAIRGARARVALDRVRESAARSGTAGMPMAKIDAIVADTRRAKGKA
jgi:antitoxin (DNA-binding transcriptional repressor) of toxin-antitoxin stability system